MKALFHVCSEVATLEKYARIRLALKSLQLLTQGDMKEYPQKCPIYLSFSFPIHPHNKAGLFVFAHIIDLHIARTPDKIPRDGKNKIGKYKVCELCVMQRRANFRTVWSEVISTVAAGVLCDLSIETSC